MLFQAVVIFLPISIFFKILSNGGKVHCNISNDFNSLQIVKNDHNTYCFLINAINFKNLNLDYCFYGSLH